MSARTTDRNGEIFDAATFPPIRVSRQNTTGSSCHQQAIGLLRASFANQSRLFEVCRTCRFVTATSLKEALVAAFTIGFDFKGIAIPFHVTACACFVIARASRGKQLASLAGQITRPVIATAFQGIGTSFQGPLVPLKGASTSLNEALTSLNGVSIPLRGTAVPSKGTSIPWKGASIAWKGTSIPCEADAITLQGTAIAFEGTAVGPSEFLCK